ncbi:hypothetical protein B0O80DRAFT_430830 [Mortierella sp. GBAus27b]|nr:hypothetical protein B0O80DRAFT_430830 [Mortierella sp. GBAus27b]
MEALKTVAGLASTDNNISGTTMLLDHTSDGYFLAVEKTPTNILFGKAILASFVLQFVIFYTVWYLVPSLNKNRRGLAWVLTLASAIVLLATTSCEIGYLRTTLWSLVGWEQHGEDATKATIFTLWAPAFHDWVFQLRNTTSTTTSVTFSTLSTHLISLESAKRLLLDSQTYKDLAGEYLQWLITLPIFSLAPLKPTLVSSPTAPYFLGGGGRLLFSLENFPRETWFSSVLCGYFVGYCLGDLILGQIHYKEHVDPTSGWIHHLTYTWLIYSLSRAQMLSHFLAAGGLLEVSTVFLASGYIFPHLREDFWFPTSFILVRIFFVGFMWHESLFNFPSVTGGCFIYGCAFLLHVFWLSKYLQGRKRRMLRAEKEREEAKMRELEKAKENGSNGHVSTNAGKQGNGVTSNRANGVVSTGSSVTKGESTIQLRAKSDK